MTDSTFTLWKSASRFFSGTMLSRLTGLLRDMAMAYGFGTQSSIAAFLVAFRLSHLLRRLLGEGAMQSALIPHFEELRKQDPQMAGRFFVDLSISLSLLLVVLISLIMVGLGLALAYLPMSSGNQEIVRLTLVMMPSLLFICLFGIDASLLQCEKRYFTSSAASVAFNLVWIAGILCTSHLEASSAMTGLGIFIIFSCFGQWAVTLPESIRVLQGFQIGRLFGSVHLFSQPVLQLAKPLALGIFGIASTQINNALDALFARWASEEGPAVLWYAIRLQQLPLALFGMAISGALLPPLARAVKQGDGARYQQFLEYGLCNCLAIMLPATAFFFALGGPCVQLLFGHGGFSHSSVVETTHALWGYAVGLLPATLILVLAPAFYASHQYRTTSLATGASMLLNMVLNGVFVSIFNWGTTSVALATSLSAWFNFVWLAVALAKKNRALQARLLTPTLWHFLTKAVLLSVTAACLSHFLKIWLQEPYSWMKLEMALEAALLLALGGAVFSVFCFPLLLRLRKSG